MNTYLVLDDFDPGDLPRLRSGFFALLVTGGSGSAPGMCLARTGPAGFLFLTREDMWGS
jgi:hypothetical protein